MGADINVFGRCHNSSEYKCGNMQLRN